MASKDKTTKGRRPPARGRKAREDQLISMASDLVEKRFRDGSATAAEILHYLKLGSTKMQLEKEKLEKENLLLKAKTDSIESQRRSEELYSQALAAFRTYAGGSSFDEEDYYVQDEDY